MIPFHLRHASISNMVLQIIALIMLLFIYIYFNDPFDIFFTMFMAVITIFPLFELLRDVIHFRNPRPSIFVLDHGFVLNFRYFEWNDIEKIVFVEELNLVKLECKSEELIHIRLETLKEPSEQFKEALQQYAPQIIG